MIIQWSQRSKYYDLSHSDMDHETYQFRNSDVILDSKKDIKKEIFEIINKIKIPGKGTGMRDKLNKAFKEEFRKRGWAPKRIKINVKGKEESFGEVDFFKDRVAIEVSFTHRSFIGVDLLKMETLSFSIKDEIDLGIMIVVTDEFQKKHFPTTAGSMTLKQITRYLEGPYKSAIDVPILVIGLKD